MIRNAEGGYSYNVFDAMCMCILYTNIFGRNTNSRIAVNVQALFLIAEYQTNFTKFLVCRLCYTN